MDVCCDLEVDVNGEGVFMVNKELFCSYSGRFRKLFGKSGSTGKNLKVIFHDFPGGAETFELIARFCYNNGSIEISPTNLTALYSAASFMEMNKSVFESENLVKQIEKSLEEISYWTWSELLLALKKNQAFIVSVNSSVVLQKCLDTLVGRLILAAEASPCPSISSPESFGFRISCDSRSTESLKTSCFRVSWWFEDLSSLSQSVIEMALRSMISWKFDHGTISRFLFHYQKSKFVHAQSGEKSKIMGMVIDVLHSLDHWSIPYKSLLGILRVSINLNIHKSTRSKLEAMIGSRLDEATLDNLLIPSSAGVSCLYDVNLVLRCLKFFLSRGLSQVSNDRLMKLARLVDLYLAEIAPDPSLKASKFTALATALPDSSRESYDEMYHAMDMYLEVHTDLSEEETFQICSALNYEKLSPEACLHLTKNQKFPSRSAVQALLSHQGKLTGLEHASKYPSSCSSSPCYYPNYGTIGLKGESSDRNMLSAGEFDVMTDNEKLRTHLQGMQCRVTELEKVCHKMQTQMAKMMKSKSTGNINARSLPKLCS
ncbi:hypothetical protein Cgig2_023336 [Carnegiea gigantea]|uniref:Phototropic-responsive NPH3 family protein n=1 Tax=Carnegiea gigantea TaxID=171969 RepID=A0A9Q1K4I7_9CARY|nr:hypothetical protein Cgig2_023336 [Carnegiea gigantea]